MNTIIVADKYDGTQQLFTKKQILDIMREYRRRYKYERIADKLFCDWALAQGIRSIWEYAMNGAPVGWILVGVER